MQIDAIEQRAGDAAAVACYLFGAAMAAAVGFAQVAAGAGIHGRDQLETGGKLGLTGRTRNHDVARFQRFAQDFEHPALEFGQFIEKQDAVVRERNFSRTRVRPPPDQGRAGGTVVRRPIGTSAPVFQFETRGADRGNGGRFDGLLFTQRRQQAGQAFGEHALAAAWGPQHEQAVAARCGQFQGALGARLAADVGQVGIVGTIDLKCVVDKRGFQFTLTRKQGHERG